MEGSGLDFHECGVLPRIILPELRFPDWWDPEGVGGSSFGFAER